VDSIKVGTDIVGNHVKVKVVKNKVAPPFKLAEFDIIFNEGISKEGGLLDVGLELGIVEKSGSWLSYNELRLGQGREAARDFLRRSPDIATQIEDDIRNMDTGYAVVAPELEAVSNA
jgi:recombination protein RecA